MKHTLLIFAAALLLCACGSKPAQHQCPYTEEEFPIHGSVLSNPDSMAYYSELAEQGDARALYIMAASYYCNDQVQPLPIDIKRVRTREEADSLLNVAAEQGYKPAIKTQECFRECRGEE
jgi:TPR repeat protein